ncbi:hypothetical protein [Silvanigrella aquatica]|uniref:Uncharacterized protein n=1 Tax=Silvanigrella aquatica TaxID=1915309 RepID=A0A1L4D138_9BACT|nr:hypothetical protein [Silvanigrella aquatica]APJ03925.1 hypothetical protein AXG55_08415 [Silvanigrella aquatica]
MKFKVYLGLFFLLSFSSCNKNLVNGLDNSLNTHNSVNLSHQPTALKSNACFYIKTSNNKYISLEKTSFREEFPKSDNSLFCFYSIEGQYRIRSATDGSYVSAANNNMVEKMPTAAGWENFISVQLENGLYAFKTFHNTYLSINANGELIQTDSLSFKNSSFYLENINIVQNSTIGDYKNFGRFGNQIFQYLFLKVYALKHGYEVRTRPWDGNFFYNLTDAKANLHLPPVSDMEWSVCDYNENLTKSYTDLNISPFNSHDIRGYFLFHNSHHKEHKEYIRTLFQVKPEIQNDFNKALIAMRSHGKKILAIHMRRDDGVQTPLNLYVDFVKNNYEKLGNPVIYLASDGLNQVMNKLDIHFPDFRNKYKVYTENDFLNLLNPEYLKGKDSGHAYFFDFYILTKADFLATSVSTFSNAAALLNDTAEKNQNETGIPAFYRPYTLPHSYVDGKWNFVANSMIQFNPWNIYPARPDNDDN